MAAPKVEHEYVVVGSGARCGTVAARLVELGRKVLVLEAGGDPLKLTGGDAVAPDTNRLGAPCLVLVPDRRSPARWRGEREFRGTRHPGFADCQCLRLPEDSGLLHRHFDLHDRREGGRRDLSDSDQVAIRAAPSGVAPINLDPYTLLRPVLSRGSTEVAELKSVPPG